MPHYYHEESVAVCCYWYDRPMIAADYARWLSGLFNILRETDSSFANMHLVELYDGGYKSVDLCENEFEKLLLANFQRDVAYINPNSSSKSATRDSSCALGFSSTFIAAENPRESRFLVEAALGKSMANSVNTLIIRCSDNNLESEYFVDLLNALARYVNPFHAHCGNQVLARRINQPVGDIHIGWLSYLSDPKVAEYLADIALVTPLGNGVMVKIGDQKRFSMDDHTVANVLTAVQRLGGAGFLTSPRKRKAPQQMR